MQPLKLTPIYEKTIWAGERMPAIRHRPSLGEGISWEISIHPHAQSAVSEGSMAGHALRTLIDADPVGMVGSNTSDKEFLRVALLDAKEPLSVQVHPDEAYAQRNESDHGKAECWYILGADAGATVVAGCDLATKDEVAAAIADDTIEQHLHCIPVQEGDFISVPAGTIHALGAGIFALEIGTNSNTTYRFYDYHRTDALGNERTLHIQKSLDVLNLEQRAGSVHTALDGVPKSRALPSVAEFDVTLIDIADSHVLMANQDCFRTLSCVRGACRLCCEGGMTKLACTESVFVPAAAAPLTIEGNCRVLVAAPHR